MAPARRPTLLLVLVLCLEVVHVTARHHHHHHHPTDDVDDDTKAVVHHPSNDEANTENEEVVDGDSDNEAFLTFGRAGGSHHHHHHHHNHHGKKESTTKSQADAMRDVKRANEHYMKIRSEASCKKPKPRVIKVKDLYPDSGKEYLPRCTLLYRCSNDIGCCDHDTMQCVPKKTHAVSLPFYIIRLHQADGGRVTVKSENMVAELKFVNHTECECQPVNNDRPRVISNQHNPRCPECPEEFSVRQDSDGACRCDCFDRQKECLRFKRGRETFSSDDRKCIESGQCTAPSCEYGVYEVSLGRCPRKHGRRNAPNGHSSWWRLDERD